MCPFSNDFILPHRVQQSYGFIRYKSLFFSSYRKYTILIRKAWYSGTFLGQVLKTESCM